MGSQQFGGQFNIIDPATKQEVNCRFFGTFHYAPGPDEGLVRMAQNQLTLAVRGVLAKKLLSNEVALPTLQQSLPHYTQEIIAEAGTAQRGVSITQLELSVQVPPAAAAPAPAPLPASPMEATANAFQQRAKEALDPSNYEVRGQVNIGGFKVKASTDGGLDTDGLLEQAKNKAKSTVIWWGIGCVILLLLGVFLLGLAWYIYSEVDASVSGKAPTGVAEETNWDGASTFRCGGSDNLRIKGVSATLSSGTAISAGANCHLELVDVNITAPTAIQAMGNAVVTVKGGSITGEKNAASALGSGQIIFKGTTVKGEKKALGANAKVTGP